MFITLLRQFYSRNLTIHDETLAGSILNQLKIRLSKEHITVQELIKERVFQEVEQYYYNQSAYYRGFIAPEHAERVLNGYRLSGNHKIDPERHFYRTMEVFRKKGFCILVDEQRLEDPEYSIFVEAKTRISFLKLSATTAEYC